ncbi:MAG: PKD domain-containing protein [Flavobacteriales bacterium]|nr:PKD domain-containing protein [Flavobacteriales bacterium]
MRNATLLLIVFLALQGRAQNICDGLNAAFTWASASTTGNPVQFSNGTVGTGQGTTWQWSFGDGTTSNDAQPLHEFPGPGTYEVCLTAITIFILPSGESITCVDEYCAPVVINGGGDPCDGFEAGFTWATTASGTGVIFSNGTTGTGFQTTWQWIFGDGTTSNEAQPDHAYAEPGTYTVCLVATTVFETSSGLITCVDEYCAPVLINGGGDPCDGFEAGFTWTTTASGTGVIFSNGTSGTGFQTTWQWIFGDGTTSSNAQPDHAYAEPGTYTVCLVATTVFETSSGLITCVDEYCAPVLINGGGDPCDGFEAGFTWTTTASGTGVIFSNGTSGTGFQTTWQWIFGDGTTSNEAQPDHAYAEPGTYTVCLVATTVFETSSGLITCVDEYCAPVLINGGGDPCDGFEAGFTWTTTASGTGVIFSNSTTGTGFQTTWQWIFGDGTTSNEAQPDHAYAEPGTYGVCLVATTIFETSAGLLTCVDEHCDEVVIGQGPEECDPLFALEIDSEGSGAGFILTASTNIPSNGITWTFDNGLVLYGPSIQVGLGSLLNIELCITAWYQPANSTDTCWTEVCGLLSELGFSVSVDETAVGGFRAWPNPAVDAVYIDGLGTGPVRVSIHGADGRVERELTVVGSPGRVDLSGLTAGMKWVTLNSTDRTERFKLVKE